jgi:hypothetical protein
MRLCVLFYDRDKPFLNNLVYNVLDPPLPIIPRVGEFVNIGRDSTSEDDHSLYLVKRIKHSLCTEGSFRDLMQVEIYLEKRKGKMITYNGEEVEK